ncbi:MAG: Uma2 family endonuclease [Candidatus Paceibacterota bacterium]
MSDTVTSRPATSWTAADLVQRFGPIPLVRVRLDPAPGTATEDDVVRLHVEEKRLYELIDGTLVEKTVGFYEAYLATVLATMLKRHIDPRGLGIVVGADGMLQIAPKLVRIPDVAFFAWPSLPGGKIPREPVPQIVPDLAVEIISRGNTKEEMNRKLRDYFAAGCQQVWYVYPQQREVHVFSSPEQQTILMEPQTLHADKVLPDLTISLRELFAIPEGEPRSET